MSNENTRLLVDSFILMDPWWTLRSSSTPYWAKFGTIPSVEKLERYLDGVEPFDETYIMLFSHGTLGANYAHIERWRPVLRRATRRSDFIGVDEQAYPRDFATFGTIRN